MILSNLVSLVNETTKLVESSNNSFLIQFSNPIMAIAAIANLVIIIIFYTKDKKYRRHEDELQRISFWFRELILSKIGYIDELYQYCFLAIETLESEKQNEYTNDLITKHIREFKVHLRQLRYEFIDSVRIVDKQFALKLDDLADKHEDYFTDQVGRLFTLQKVVDSAYFVKFTNLLRDKKNELLSLIYVFEKNHYTYKQKDVD